MTIPDNITREHIEKAIKKIDKSGIPSDRDSKIYKLVFNGCKYSPKHVISLANKAPNKKELPPSDFSGGNETNAYLQRLGFDIYKNGNLLEVKKIKKPWVATVILKSKEKFCKTDNDERCKAMPDIIKATAERTQGDGVFVLPGGFFNTGRIKASENHSKWVKAIIKELKEYRRKIVVCFGVDGREMKDQLALAVSREGCIAMGRKFYPAKGEEAVIQKAECYLALENKKPRIFKLAGKQYYLAVCYDVYGIHKENLENPGIDVVLNFVHQFNPRGKDASGDTYFIKYGLAQGSKQWACPVFASATFFEEKNIPPDWPSGVFWNQGELPSNKWKYKTCNGNKKHNPIEPSLSFLKEIPEGQALIRVFQLGAGMKGKAKLCKKDFLKALRSIDPDVEDQYSNPFPADPANWDKDIFKIHHHLMKGSKDDGRGPKGNTLSKTCKPFDYYLPKFNCFLEFDEPQHFTLARAESLRLYPKNIPLGFDKKKWIGLCNELRRTDRDPPHRDEQRAWLDTLRDLGPIFGKRFLPPEMRKLRPTVRVYEKDFEPFKADVKLLAEYLHEALSK